MLNEQKEDIINRAVTRGLDPNVRLKPCDIEWLGEVPEHWQVVPMRWYIRIGSGDFLHGQEIVSERSPTNFNPVIGGNGVMGYSAAKNCYEPTIVIGRVGALCGNVHFIHGPMWITDNALRLSRVRKFNLDYLAMLLRAMNLNRLAKANAQPLITSAMVKRQIGVLPPTSEQIEVVNFVREATHALDTSIERARREIDLIREYRTCLITDVVTGKVDVRHASSEISEELAEPADLDEGIDDEELLSAEEPEIDEEVADSNT